MDGVHVGVEWDGGSIVEERSVRKVSRIPTNKTKLTFTFRQIKSRWTRLPVVTHKALPKPLSRPHAENEDFYPLQEDRLVLRLK